MTVALIVACFLGIIAALGAIRENTYRVNAEIRVAELARDQEQQRLAIEGLQHCLGLCRETHGGALCVGLEHHGEAHYGRIGRHFFRWTSKRFDARPGVEVTGIPEGATVYNQPGRFGSLGPPRRIWPPDESGESL